jgi:Saxitoxin biosynthesis operon protein SxtJ
MKREFFKRQITADQSRDTGMAMVLLLLIVAASRKREGYLYIAMALQVFNMIKPTLFRPIAVVWLALSDLLGAVMSKVLMAVVFFVVVTPMGIIRRLAGKDSMRLRAFKASKDSVMVERNHKFVGADLNSPY